MPEKKNYRYGYLSEVRIIDDKHIGVLFGIPFSSGKWYSKQEFDPEKIDYIMREIGVPEQAIKNKPKGNLKCVMFLFDRYLNKEHPIFCIMHWKEKKSIYIKALNEGIHRIPKMLPYDNSTLYWNADERKKNVLCQDLEDFMALEKEGQI